MGIISDAIDALEDWCKDLFKDGITSQFDGISDLLSDTFSQTTGTGGSGGLVNDFVTQHPSQFTGGGTGGTTIWTTIETLCNNVVVPIGGFILTVILLNELIQMVLRGNNFKDFDDSIFITSLRHYFRLAQRYAPTDLPHYSGPEIIYPPRSRSIRQHSAD